MRITVNDYVSKGYLYVGQELELIMPIFKTPLILYIDSGVVSCMYNNVVLQYKKFEKLVVPLGLFDLNDSILTRIYTKDGRTMFDIRQKYIRDFMNKFHINKSWIVGGKIVFEILDRNMEHVDIEKLHRQILTYNRSLTNIDIIFVK